jgi:hypothetical protein
MTDVETVPTAVAPYRSVRAGAVRSPRRKDLEALPDDYLDCRQDHDLPAYPDEAQRWRYYQAGRRDHTDVIHMRWCCRRCGSWVNRWVREDDGRLWKPSRWDYVPGFKVHNEPGDRRPVQRSEAKLEWVRRWLARNPIASRQVGFVGRRGRVHAEDPGGGETT